jgi:multicomponent Na+:H+ antiporter subunit B
MEAVINMALLTLLAVVTLAIVVQRSLVGVVILGAIYSFLMASVMIVLDAVDVALTEASVGAGISTVLLLAALHMTNTREYAPRQKSIMPLVLTFMVGGVLIWGSFALPPFGAADAPIHEHVAPRYIETMAETGVPNMVTAVLADYRSFDTLGETTVVMVAGIGVMLLLRGVRRRGIDREASTSAMSLDLVLAVGIRLIVLFIFLFALYVQFHGDYGPGGGFQAGVIAAAAVILVAITFGLRAARLVAPRPIIERMIPLGVLIFAGTGVISLFFGENFLNYRVLAGDALAARHLGIFLVEAGVLITVFGAMIALFYAFVERER